MKTVMMVTQIGNTMEAAMVQELPHDLQEKVQQGILGEKAARRLAARREVLEVLWGLAREAGIEEQLMAKLA